MDFQNIIAELKAAQEDFKRSDKSFATASFCQVACKTLDNIVKERTDEKFDNLVVRIWIVIDSVSEIIPQLVDGPSLTELVEKLFRQCARVVLDIKWQQLDEEDECRQNFQKSLSICHQQMAPRGFTRFGVLHELMDNPWTDPVLTMVMGSEEDNEEGEGLAYIQAQDPEILKLRVELIYQENCDEFALNLCTWCLKHPALAADFKLHRTQFVLLHRLSYIDKLQEECQKMGSVDSIRLINSLQGKEEYKELSTMLAHTFLVQNWIKPSDNHSEIELLRLWVKLQYQADQDQDQFISSLWAIAKVSRSTEQLLFIIDAVREQCGDTFLQFCLDLCIFAINVDKGCWEKLKESTTAGLNKEIMERKKDMAQVCNKLAHIVAHVSPKIAFCCALTAFSMQPSEQLLQAVRDTHLKKTLSPKSLCCSNCAASQGDCLKNDDSDDGSHNVNVATLYEVERLCSILRPEYLSCDIDLSSLLSLCKQYMMKEKGEAVQSALVQRKTGSATQHIQLAASGTNTSKQESRAYTLQRPATATKTVDAASHVDNVSISQNIFGSHNQNEIHSGKSEHLLPAQQTAKGGTAANHSIIQQLVLKQLPSDTVQTLLHLIQSSQISPVQLNLIMTKNPSRAVQILQNIVQHAKAGTLQSVIPHPVQQQNIHEQQIQQQQQRSNQSMFRMPRILQSASPQQRGVVTVPCQSGIQSQSGVQCQQPVTQLRAQPRVMGGQVLTQQQSALTGQSFRLRPQQQTSSGSSLIQQSQILRGVRQIRPALPTVHLSNPGEIKVTQPVHIMTFRQSTPAKASASAVPKQMLIHTSSHMLTHLSGGNVTSMQKKAQIVCLPSSVSASSHVVRPSLQTAPKVIPKTQCPNITSQGTNVASNQVRSSVDEITAGDRHYSINNLLFTGEEQSNALSITIPDRLPEISVDSVSDTLRALSDLESPDSQTIQKVPMKCVEMPIPQAASQASITQLPISMLQISSDLSPAASKLAKPPTKQHISIGPAQVQMCSTNPALNSQKSPSFRGHASVSQQSAQNVRPLPSFSSVFVSNPSPLPVPAPITSTVSSPSVFMSSQTVKGSFGPGKGGKKMTSGEKLVKKERETTAAEKEKMMQLLKEAITIKVGKDGIIGGETSHRLFSGQPSVPSVHSVPTLATGLESSKTSTAQTNFHSSNVKLLVHQSSQPGHTSLGAYVSQQSPITVLHNVGSTATTVPVKTTCATLEAGAGGSEYNLPSASSVFSGHSSEVRGSGLFPAFISSNQSHSKQPSFIYEQGAVRKLADVSVSVVDHPLQSVGATASFQSSKGQSVNTVGDIYLLSSAVPATGANSVTAQSAGSMGSVRTYSKTETGKTLPSQQDLKESVTPASLASNILPEGGVIETGGDGDQSIATYRCIICAKAFMTLDALRLHVKQICKPGLNQPANLGNRMAINKAQATEAGLETSTVFQCMRCFELCISETGIREHKLVCSKAPKPKAKVKSRAKPKPPSTEEDQATEAKVLELLNKCLGENREKLLQETTAQANKQVTAKKKLSKKRPSVEEEPTGIVSDSKRLRQDESSTLTSTAVKTEPGCSVFMNTVDSMTKTTMPIQSVKAEVSSVVASGQANVMQPFKKIPESVSSAAVTVISTPTIVSGAAAATASQAHIPVASVKPKTSLSTVNSMSTNSLPAKAMSGICDPEHVKGKSGQKDEGLKTRQLCQPPCIASSVGKVEDTDVKPCKQEIVPPPPQYKEISGSGSQSFFKCLNCGQTLCSIESFQEHWLECIVKKPLKSKPESQENSESNNNSSNKSDESCVSENDIASPAVNTSNSTFTVMSCLKVGDKSACTNPCGITIPRIAAKQIAKEVTGVGAGVGAQSIPIIKDSIVLLEKVSIPQKARSITSKGGYADGETGSGSVYEETGALSQTDKNNRHSAKSSFASSVSLPNTKKARVLLPKMGKPPYSKGRGVFIKRKDMTDRTGDRSVKIVGPSQSGDSKYCEVCRRYFNKRTLLIQHLASVHVHTFNVRKAGNVTSYLCQLCQKVFPQYSQFMTHANSHSQAIVQKFNEMNCVSKLSPSEGRCRVARVKIATGGNLNKNECATSELSKDNEDYDETSKDGRSHTPECSAVISSSPVTAQITTEPSTQMDRRSYGRAAHKQALNKIFISSLGITSSAEPLRENNKRKTSCDSRSPTERPKRSKVSRSWLENKSEEDEENTEESDGDADCKGNISAKESSATSVSSVQESKAAEKTDVYTPQSVNEHRPGKFPTTEQCTSNGSLPYTSPRLSSPISVAPKKPSFLDSFLSFVNSRSPEAPLPLNQSRRRYSYLHDNLDRQNLSSPTLSHERRNSCDVLMTPLHQDHKDQPTTPISPPAVKSPHRSGVTVIQNTPKPKSPISQSSKEKSDGYDSVYFYGEYEKQLTQQCKVNLGQRVKAEDVHVRPAGVHCDPAGEVISVKQCIVNLGPKVTPAMLIPAFVKCDADQPILSKEQNVEKAETHAISEPTVDDVSLESDSDTVVVSGSAPSPFIDMDDTVSLDEMPLPKHASLSSTKDASEADAVCVEATQSVLPIPETFPVDADVMAVVRSMASQVAAQSPVSALPSTFSTSPTEETVTVSTISLGPLATRLAMHVNQTIEDARCPVSICNAESVDSICLPPSRQHNHSMVVTAERNLAESVYSEAGENPVVEMDELDTEHVKSSTEEKPTACETERGGQYLAKVKQDIQSLTVLRKGNNKLVENRSELTTQNDRANNESSDLHVDDVSEDIKKPDTEHKTALDSLTLENSGQNLSDNNGEVALYMETSAEQKSAVESCDDVPAQVSFPGLNLAPELLSPEATAGAVLEQGPKSFESDLHPAQDLFSDGQDEQDAIADIHNSSSSSKLATHKSAVELDSCERDSVTQSCETVSKQGSVGDVCNCKLEFHPGHNLPVECNSLRTISKPHPEQDFKDEQCGDTSANDPIPVRSSISKRGDSVPKQLLCEGNFSVQMCINGILKNCSSAVENKDTKTENVEMKNVEFATCDQKSPIVGQQWSTQSLIDHAATLPPVPGASSRSIETRKSDESADEVASASKSDFPLPESQLEVQYHDSDYSLEIENSHESQETNDINRSEPIMQKIEALETREICDESKQLPVEFVPTSKVADISEMSFEKLVEDANCCSTLIDGAATETFSPSSQDPKMCCAQRVGLGGNTETPACVNQCKTEIGVADALAAAVGKPDSAHKTRKDLDEQVQHLTSVVSSHDRFSISELQVEQEMPEEKLPVCLDRGQCTEIFVTESESNIAPAKRTYEPETPVILEDTVSREQILTVIDSGGLPKIESDNICQEFASCNKDNSKHPSSEEMVICYSNITAEASHCNTITLAKNRQSEHISSTSDMNWSDMEGNISESVKSHHAVYEKHVGADQGSVLPQGEKMGQKDQKTIETSKEEDESARREDVDKMTTLDEGFNEQFQDLQNNFEHPSSQHTFAEIKETSETVGMSLGQLSEQSDCKLVPDRSSMSMMDFLQKSAFPILKVSAVHDSHQINMEKLKDTTGFAKNLEAGEMIQNNCNDSCDWDTCDDKVNIIALPEDVHPQVMSVTPLVESTRSSSVCESKYADHVDADEQLMNDEFGKSDASHQANSESYIGDLPSLTVFSEDVQKEQNGCHAESVDQPSCSIPMSTDPSSSILHELEEDSSHSFPEPLSPDAHEAVDEPTSYIGEPSSHTHLHEDADRSDFHYDMALNNREKYEGQPENPTYPGYPQMDATQSYDDIQTMHQSYSSLDTVKALLDCDVSEADQPFQESCNQPSHENPEATGFYKELRHHQSSGFQPSEDKRELMERASDVQLSGSQTGSDESGPASPIDSISFELTEPECVQSARENSIPVSLTALNVGFENVQPDSKCTGQAAYSTSVHMTNISEGDSLPIQPEKDASDSTFLGDSSNLTRPEAMSDLTEREMEGYVGYAGEKLEATSNAEKLVTGVDSESKQDSLIKTTGDVDPDGDLPELCIVPDPQGVIIKSCLVSPPGSTKTEPENVFEDDVRILSTAMNEYEVKVRPLLTNKAKQKVKRTFCARIEVKEEKVAVEETEETETGPLESPTDTKKPLLGVKSLRRVHKPEPFVWEVDGEEDGKKRARNERSIKAFRSKVHIVPFSWDYEAHDQERNKPTEDETALDSETFDQSHSKQPLKLFRQKVGSVPFTWDAEESGDIGSSNEKDGDKFNSNDSAINTRNSYSKVDDMAKNTYQKSLKHVDQRTASSCGGKQQTASMKNSCKMDKSKSNRSPEKSNLESVRLTRSREIPQSGSCEKSMCAASPSFSRTKIASLQRDRPFRKSRSLDIEDCRKPCALGLSTSARAESQERIPVTHVKEEIETSNKQSNRSVSSLETIPSKEDPPSYEDHVQHISEQSPEAVTQSPSIRKWKQGHPSSILTKSANSSSKTKTSEHVSGRPRIRRQFYGANRSDVEPGNVCAKSKTSLRSSGAKLSSPGKDQRVKRQRRAKDSIESNMPQAPSSTHCCDSNACAQWNQNKVRSQQGCEGASEADVMQSKSLGTLRPDQGNNSTNSQCNRNTLPRKATNQGDDIDHVSKSYSKGVVRSCQDRFSKTPNVTSVCRETRSSSVTSQKCVTERPVVSSTGEPSEPKVQHSEPTVKRKQPPLLASDSSVHHTSSSTSARTSDSQVTPKDQAESKQVYLAATVRRRKQQSSWRTVSPRFASKPRTTAVETPQYEVIRVEPAKSDSPVEQRRIRSNETDAEPAPRTVHRRVSVNELKPVPSRSEMKISNDQKWLIDRKKTVDPRFPFSFKRTKTKTEMK